MHALALRRALYSTPRARRSAQPPRATGAESHAPSCDRGAVLAGESSFARPHGACAARPARVIAPPWRPCRAPRHRDACSAKVAQVAPYRRS